MIHQFLIANWKSNKTTVEAQEWLESFRQHVTDVRIPLDSITIILCAPFTLLPLCKDVIHKYALPIQLAAQNVSAFEEGAYTGEVNAKQLKEFVSYVMIGHSERRKYFNETDAILAQKVKQSQEQGLEVMYCVENATDAVPDGVSIISYEPKAAIGSGQAASASEANVVCEAIKKRFPKTFVLYGGSASVENVIALDEKKSIDGILSGTASLTVDHFFSLLTRMSSVTT